jgi:transposase-like protein
MAKREDFKMPLAERRRRTFSTSFKKEKVRKIELGLVKISELCKLYEVSATAIYKWINLYGTQKQPERLVMQTASDEKALLELKAKLAELERLLGQKQIEIEFYKKMVDVAEDHYDIDIKKNFSTQLSGTSGCTENNTPSA